jgi:NADPH:quinone reductase-like Zn-dependent oxidoreductase/aryl carrier-like protein
VTQSESSHPLLGQRLTLADPPGALVWQRQLNRQRLPYLDDHQVQGTSLLPAAAYIEMALAAARELWGEGIYTVTTLSIGKGLFLPETSLPIVQVIFQLDGPAEASVRIYSQMAETDSWTLHASGVVRQEQVATDELQLPHDVETETHTYTEIDVVEYYAALRQQGLQYGDAFQALARLWQGQGRAVGLVRPASAVAATDLYHLHPVLLDACCQVLGAAAQTHMNGNGRSTLYLPYYFERVRVYGRINDHIWSRASLQPTAPADEVHGDILLRDDTGQLIAEIQGLRLKRLDKVVAGENENDWLYQLIWSPQARIAATAVTQPSTWIIVSGSRALPSRISDLFEQAGHHAVLIPGETVRHNGKSEHALTRAKIWQQLVKQPFTVQGIVYLGETSHIRLAKTAPDEAALQRVMELLHLVQALAQLSHPPRLWIVTTGAQVVASSPTVPNIAQTPLWGMGRTLQHEHPEMACTLIDLSQHPTAAELDELLQELQEPSSDQVALRTGMRYLPRLQRFTPRSTTQSVISIKDDMAFHLAIDEPGTLTNLHLRALQARSPEPDEVEIEVQAAGLNFADVMKALGVAPGIEGAPILGVECAGWITAVGSNITNFSVGDAVVAIAPNCLGNRVITPACLVTPKPDRLSFVDAATIPIAFITAYYALCQLGQLQAGERVLIHAATGGVGQAAVQIAQWREAEIFATAGSPAKRDFLRSLGIQQVMDSRSLAFADEIRGQTNGLGVNVVLNSLAGTALRASLDVLGCYGRFLEIGKRDIYAAADLGLAPFRRNLTFAAIDLERMVKERPQQVGELLQTVMTHVRSGEWQPLPAQLFPITEAASAFRIMARAQHMGKIVLSSQVAPGISVRATKAVTISADVSYLITGGWGALGLTVVDWLVEMGARHLVLVGRSEPGETAVTQIKSWQATGVQIILKQANVTKLHQMQQILKEVSDTMPPLRGVVHAAGVLNDGTLQHLEPAQVAAVFAPKVAGAWHLHQLTADLELDFFLLFSSAASLLGSPGQGNYAAANMFMDGLAQLRNAQGLPGLSINWGPWADIGLAARADRVGRLDKQGVGAIKPAQGKAILSRLWAQRVAQVGVIPFDWDKMKVMTGGSWSILKDVMDISASRANPSARITLLSLEPDARLSWLITHLRRQVAQVLGATAVNLDEQQPLTNLGLDSLMAVELKNRIERDLGVSLPMVTFLQGPTLPQMAENLLLELSMDDPPEKEPLPVHLSDLTVEELATQVDEATLMAQLEQLSDDDVELLLGQMLSDE